MNRRRTYFHAGLFALLCVLPGVTSAAEARSPSFTNDVVPLLTRLGCNQGACHGKGVGQNGFRLSLRGYAPELDHAWMTREYLTRRVTLAVPEQSLLLRKAVGEVPHAGGRLVSTGSREYNTLRDWIAAGAPGVDKTDPHLLQLTVQPGDRTLAIGETLPLRVDAQFSDGQTRDVTWLTRFDSNDAGMVEVSPQGVVRVLRSGETSIRASFQDQVAIVLISSPYPDQAAAQRARETPRNNMVDEHVFAKLASLQIEPSPLCTDAEFIRRAFLDTLGTLPEPDEVRAFLADTAADKRARLIDTLLERPEYVDYWTLQLGDLLQNRKERDHDVRGTKGVRAFHAWLRQQVAANRPWDQLARDVLTATGGSSASPAVGYFVVTVGEKGQASESEVVASVAQSFLGTRIGCAQCHNHPLEKYTQDDYYHFAAFFSRLQLKRQDPRKGPTELVPFDPNRKEPVGVSQPRTGQFMAPQSLERRSIAIEPGEDPRIKLAAYITDPSNPSFAGAMVNRQWRHFLGVGLVEPVDDLRASNPPTNPALWNALVAEFTSHTFDLRHLQRLILNSRTYQLSAATTAGNETETRFYSHYYARRLPAEVLLDALSASTGVPDTFPGYPVGTRAIQLPDPGLGSYFLALFGRSERVTACACERRGEVTLPQLLHLQNGEAITAKIRSGDGRLARLLAQSDPHAITAELFLATLSRSPTPEEQAAVDAALAAGDTREDVYRDLFWALLNSKEFAFNR